METINSSLVIYWFFFQQFSTNIICVFRLPLYELHKHNLAANPLYLLGNTRESHHSSEVGLAWRVNINKAASGSTSRSVWDSHIAKHEHKPTHNRRLPALDQKGAGNECCKRWKKLRNSVSSCFSSWKLLNHQQLLTDWVVNLSLCSGRFALCWRGACGDVWSCSPGGQQTHAWNATAWLSRASLCKQQWHFASTSPWMASLLSRERAEMQSRWRGSTSSRASGLTWWSIAIESKKTLTYKTQVK